jgi:hypothetical protein
MILNLVMNFSSLTFDLDELNLATNIQQNFFQGTQNKQ